MTETSFRAYNVELVATYEAGESEVWMWVDKATTNKFVKQQRWLKEGKKIKIMKKERRLTTIETAMSKHNWC